MFLVYATAVPSAPPVIERKFASYDAAAKYARTIWRQYMRVCVVGPDNRVMGY